VFALGSIALAAVALLPGDVRAQGVGAAKPASPPTPTPPAGAIPRPNSVPAAMRGKVVPKPMAPLKPSQKSAVKVALKSAAAKFKLDKNVGAMQSLPKGLDGPSGAVYARASTRYVTKQKVVQLAGAGAATATIPANYGIDGSTVVYWSLVNCKVTVTLELLVRNRGAATPPASSPPGISIVTYDTYSGDLSPGNHFNYQVPLLAGGTTATVYAGTFTNDFGAGCGNFETDLRLGYLHFGSMAPGLAGADYFMHVKDNVVHVDEVPEADPDDALNDILGL
jgi:hypothetical protein